MKILGIGNKKLIVEIDEEDFGNLAGFYSTYSLKEKFPIEPGTYINIGICYKDAIAALTTHQQALTAASTLKGAATRFLNFFKDMPEK